MESQHICMTVSVDSSYAVLWFALELTEIALC